MAPWIMHLRIAELVNSFLCVSEREYYVGTIAPDSGRMSDKFSYEPPKCVTHWYEKDKDRFPVNDSFYEKYARHEADSGKKAFYLGYYVHLLTDSFFIDEIIHPFIEMHGREYWRENIDAIRKSWYELDLDFLNSHRTYHPFEVLCQVTEFPNVYLDYFSEDEIFARINEMCGFYQSLKPDKSVKPICLESEQANEFIKETARRIITRLEGLQ